MKTIARVAGLTLLASMIAQADPAPIYDLKLKDIDGKWVQLSDYKGKVLLVVNVASQCGYTKQYAGLEALYQKYKDQGLVILGFPCNQFGGQEPGSSTEIKQFCSTKFNVTFPMFDKVDVNGPARAPLYTLLAGKNSPLPGDIKWNFNKFLIGCDGALIKRFDSRIAPDAADLTSAVEAALAKK